MEPTLNEIDLKAFMQKTQQGKSFVVIFYAPFCGTCQVAMKMLYIVHKMMPNVEFVQLNLNYAPELSEKFQIQSVPCVSVVRDGEIRSKHYAVRSVEFLFETIKDELYRETDTI